MGKKTKKFDGGGFTGFGGEYKGQPDLPLEPVSPEDYVGLVGATRNVGKTGLQGIVKQMMEREGKSAGIDVPATGQVTSKAIKVIRNEPKPLAKPLTKQETRARNAANAEVNKQLPRMPRQSKSYNEEMPEPELNFKKGGKVSSASKRADGCAVRGKTRA